MNYHLVVDIGNTNIVIGIYTDGALVNVWRLKTDASKTEDEYYVLIAALLAEKGIKLKEISKSALASVVTKLTSTFLRFSEKYLSCKMISVDGYTDLGLSFPVKDPGFIGADLIVNAYAAVEKYKTNCLICDLGTASTIQLAGADKYFYGTVIAPGMMISAQSLFKEASMLSKISLATPPAILGTNTQDALRSGIIFGNAFMIDAFLKYIRLQYRQLGEIKSIVTGGMAALISDLTEEIDVIDVNLTLEGLEFVCNKF
ncbi:MAG: pantothenate kinase [Candidatus Cloacimonadota bacterium]|nr:MAG: pantothenate kinase [Candidatus Cloacimonadota bacterium]